MTSSQRTRSKRIHLTSFDWLAAVFILFAFVLVLGGTTITTVSAGELMVAVTVLAGAFIVRGGLARPRSGKLTEADTTFEAAEDDAPRHGTGPRRAAAQPATRRPRPANGRTAVTGTR